MVTVERFDISRVPEHGRPKVAEFTGREGSVAVHCSREDGSLWLFAKGPAGGDRGGLAVPLESAGELWLWAENPTPLMPVGGGWLAVRRGKLHVAARGRRALVMVFDDAALAELLTCLRSWAVATVRR